jgi:putative NADH-flavin reductase
MGKPRILIVGATGRTGSVIVDALLEAGETVIPHPFRSSLINILMIHATASRSAYPPRIRSKVICPTTQLASILIGVDTVICALSPDSLFEQLPLADAAKKAGVKRFVPCAFMTVCPPGGIMWIRDQVCNPL